MLTNINLLQKYLSLNTLNLSINIYVGVHKNLSKAAGDRVNCSVIAILTFYFDRYEFGRF